MSNDLRHWIALLLLLFTVSCATPEEQNTATVISQPHWTTCIHAHGFNELLPSATASSPSGFSEQSGLIKEVGGTDLPYLQRVNSSKGIVRDVHITLEVDRTQNTDSIYTQLFERMSEVYGAAEPTQAYASWRAATQGGTLMEIELMDGRPLFQRNEIILHWKEYQDRRYED